MPGFMRLMSDTGGSILRKGELTFFLLVCFSEEMQNPNVT